MPSTDFERLLARQLHRIALGAVAATVACGGAPGDKKVADYCAGNDLPAEHVIDEGYVLVEVGEACPETPESLSHTNCCPDHVYADALCGFSRKVENQAVVRRRLRSLFPRLDSIDTGGYYSRSRAPTTSAGTRACSRRPGAAAASAARRRGRVLPAGPGRPRPRLAGTSRTPTAPPSAATGWLPPGWSTHRCLLRAFTLDLMRLGAPPALLAAAQQAGLDEVDHAQPLLRPRQPRPRPDGGSPVRCPWAICPR